MDTTSLRFQFDDQSFCIRCWDTFCFGSIFWVFTISVLIFSRLSLILFILGCSRCEEACKLPGELNVVPDSTSLLCCTYTRFSFLCTIRGALTSRRSGWLLILSYHLQENFQSYVSCRSESSLYFGRHFLTWNIKLQWAEGPAVPLHRS